MNKLTLKEAAEQGYEYFLYSGEKFQSLKELAFITDADFENGKLELVNKDPYHPNSGIDADDILDFLAEQSWLNHHEESGDDTDAVSDIIRTIPKGLFDPILSAIEAKLNTLNYYKSSGIELIKDNIK